HKWSTCSIRTANKHVKKHSSLVSEECFLHIKERIKKRLEKFQPLFIFYFPTMFSGLTHSSNWSAVKWLLFTADSFNVVPSLCACLAIAAAFSYPICGFNAVSSINELLT